MSTVRLHPDDVRAIAEAVVELLGGSVPLPMAGPLVTARQLAERLGVDSKTIYRHGPELGGVQVGRAWRFDLTTALAAWPARGGDRSGSEIPQAPRTAAAAGSKPRRRRPATPSHCQLLPVGRSG